MIFFLEFRFVSFGFAYLVRSLIERIGTLLWRTFHDEKGLLYRTERIRAPTRSLSAVVGVGLSLDPEEKIKASWSGWLACARGAKILTRRWITNKKWQVGNKIFENWPTLDRFKVDIWSGGYPDYLSQIIPIGFSKFQLYFCFPTFFSHVLYFFSRKSLQSTQQLKFKSPVKKKYNTGKKNTAFSLTHSIYSQKYKKLNFSGEIKKYGTFGSALNFEQKR